MTKFFIALYDYFQKHRLLFYLLLTTCVLVMGYFASQVKFEENVTRFFPDTKDARNATKVFDNLKVKDKIILMLSAADTTASTPVDSLIEAAGDLEKELKEKLGNMLIKDIFVRVDENLINEASDFVYNHLPLFLNYSDYFRFDSLLTDEAIDATMQRNYTNLLSPAGMALRNFILKDPLSLGGGALKHLQDFQLEANYEIINGHIFSPDGNTLLMFVTPVFGTGSTGKNEQLVHQLETELEQINQKYPTIRAEYFGGPSVGVYNARQIKQDTLLTSSIAIVIIIVFISLVFKRKRSIPLIITPVLFGAVFALCLIYFFKGSISAISVGAGSAVLGIALSYSIHMLAHQNHVSSVQQLIKELAYPLTVGSFTTIGAFMGLVFTSSELLRDFGLFASLTLIGTTLFCLLFLPQFLKGQAHVKQGCVLRFIERINAYPFHKNRWLAAGILVMTLICLFTSQWVKFNDDMMSINYEPKHLKQSEEKLTRLFENNDKTVLFVSVGKNMEEATSEYNSTNSRLAILKTQKQIKDYATAEQFFVSPKEQQRRLERWAAYWTPEKKATLRASVETAARKHHFREGSFDAFYRWMDGPFERCNYETENNDASSRLLNEWQTSADSIVMLISQVRIQPDKKEAVYDRFSKDSGVVIFDRAYFANKWVSAVNNDFYFILYLSSFLIFFALWASYGRIELTLISFLPMMVSWVIILGLMGILGIEFNIINIILSTFIFGIGDDFSIFIMDGLQSKYRTGQKVLNSHKTAIFFSAFTTIVGMGALAFAQHPALQSISLISILGMVAVVLVAYTIQPIIYGILISNPASKGLPPYTLASILRTFFLFVLFLLGCIFLRVLIVLFYLVPGFRKSKKQCICRLIGLTCRGILALAFFVRKEHVNYFKETFKKPAIIIANHQSFIDILVLLSFPTKMVMLTNEWVWKSPFFGAIIRYADFYYIGEGYELSVGRLRRKVKEGYSIAIFPEGTRTYNGRMKRFHKGAFYLAEALQLDILPIILYGNGQIIAKAQPFNIRKGIIHTEILPRIPRRDPFCEEAYQKQSKDVSVYMRKQYERIRLQMSYPCNPAFHEALIQNYIYKGPVTEWYTRIKVKMENNYNLFHAFIPEKGQITDIGCGLGMLCNMLSLLSEERQILGIDYDEEKIAIARHGWLRQEILGNGQRRAERLHFEHADALEYELPESDVFILADILHYMSYERQHALLTKCAALLRPGGLIIIRDGNKADAHHHRLTRFTELWSTKIIGFNHTTEALCFTSEEQIIAIGQACNLKVETLRNDAYTSNTIYLFRKRRNES